MTYEQLQKLLATDTTTLEVELERAPVYFEIICEHVAHLWLQYNSFERESKSFEALLGLKIRAEASGAAKAPTVDHVKSMVESNTELNEIKQGTLEAEAEYRKWLGLKESFKAKIDNLPTLIKMYRQSQEAYAKV
jgi:hypothetical protein